MTNLLSVNKRLPVRELYPELSDEKLRDAEAHLERYLAVVVRIAERLHSADRSYAQSQLLTRSSSDAAMEEERSTNTRIDAPSLTL